MRVLLAGASGAIGLPLTRRLREAGHDVTAIHRSAAGREKLLAAGAAPVHVDVLDRPGLLQALDGHRFDAVISQLTALKKPPMMHRDMAATNRLRIEGTQNLLAAAARTGAERFVNQSMVFGYGYGDFGGRVLTEADRFGPPGRGRFEHAVAAMRSSERQIFDADHVSGISLRYGLFYGPGPAGDAVVDGLRRRRLPVVRNGGVLPWVYVDDAADATLAALERGAPDTAYNVADDEPVSFSDLATAIAAAVGAPKPPAVPTWLLTSAPYAKAMMTGGVRMSSAKAHEELGWRPQRPTYREGVAELAEHYSRPAV
ncbi:NAD(P)-dependent oxidoreductase [Streptomonospora sp. PA3]|uniref:NAD-dependent epimerase/dehydratase family protein n=1 Tax=Streptomonospora sp. PA3 TaxID=2607326 RepID=UPI0012DC06DC|nr:NAD(P)-dependent oxidoreductase [Streptomonospora sp. PA3]MUL43050.1 NAD(P)-dependent oxidoreductase [Streptomonospora sp. PA3]